MASTANLLLVITMSFWALAFQESMAGSLFEYSLSSMLFHLAITLVLSL